MNHVTETTEWGSFALVSYIPDPLGSFLHGLRQALPGDDNPQPHITILPPRPLKLAVDAASQQAQNILLQFPAFEVELSRVRSFPETNVFYLEVGKGNGLLHDLHDALNAGDLDYTEEFDFRPHLTLSGPVNSAQLPWVRGQAEIAWYSSDHPRQFILDEIVFLWLSPETSDGQWHRVWSHSLSGGEDTNVRAATAAVRSRTW
jgi:2'-5' RNA ligase